VDRQHAHSQPRSPSALTPHSAAGLRCPILSTVHLPKLLLFPQCPNHNAVNLYSSMSRSRPSPPNLQGFVFASAPSTPSVQQLCSGFGEHWTMRHETQYCRLIGAKRGVDVCGWGDHTADLLARVYLIDKKELAIGDRDGNLPCTLLARYAKPVKTKASQARCNQRLRSKEFIVGRTFLSLCVIVNYMSSRIGRFRV